MRIISLVRPKLPFSLVHVASSWRKGAKESQISWFISRAGPATIVINIATSDNVFSFLWNDKKKFTNVWFSDSKWRFDTILYEALMRLAKKFKSYNDVIYTVFLLQLLRVPSSPLLTYFGFYIHLQVTIGIIIRDCEAIFFLIIESVPREHSSSSLEITYLYCVRCWVYTLYVVYCRMYCTHRACTVSGAVYSVCCVQYCMYTILCQVLCCRVWPG